MRTEVSQMLGISGLFVVIGVSWLAIGVTLSILMGRRGHNSFGWLVIGTLLGPFAIALAADARHSNERLRPLPVPGMAGAGVRAAAGQGPVDVLVGSDGSPESDAAIDAVVDLLGDRMGRLTLATVVPFGDIKAPERQASEKLRSRAGRAASVDLEILHGHPSDALRQFAVDGGYQLIVVGTRGKGVTRAILGSAATELARDSEVPVLLVGERQRVAKADAARRETATSLAVPSR
jgi:nucleotide-binding universal stress UspA family protein